MGLTTQLSMLISKLDNNVGKVNIVQTSSLVCDLCNGNHGPGVD